MKKMNRIKQMFIESINSNLKKLRVLHIKEIIAESVLDRVFAVGVLVMITVFCIKDAIFL